MLIDFSFSNYRSFKDEQSFSMTRDNRFIDDSFGNTSTIAAVYGSNASGKSNFLRAFHTMCRMVKQSYSQGDAGTGVYREPFLLCDETKQKDSMFFAEFLANDHQKYQYWFRFDNNTIVEENLSLYKRLGNRLSTHRTLLFSREGTDIEFGQSFKGPRAQIKQTVGLRPNALVLSAAAAAGITCTQSVYLFFAQNVAFYDALSFDDEQPFILEQFNKGNEFAKHLSALIRYADFGIKGMESAPADIPAAVLESFKQQLRAKFGAADEKLEQMFEQHPMQLRFEHVDENSTAKLGMGDESKGTLAALSFFSLALRHLSRPSIALIDEIDTSLHPTLAAELISLFTDPDTNPQGSQLIFTTHDTSLITASGEENHLIDPDQVWLVEKTTNGASEIYPLTDLKIRRGENIGRNYLNGIYGAVPTPDFHSLFAQIINNTIHQ